MLESPVDWLATASSSVGGLGVSFGKKAAGIDVTHVNELGLSLARAWSFAQQNLRAIEQREIALLRLGDTTGRPSDGLRPHTHSSLVRG